MIIDKEKGIILGFIVLFLMGVSFFNGRKTAKPQIDYVDKIKYIDRIKYVERKQTVKKGHIVIVSKKDLKGNIIIRKTIDYDNRSKVKVNKDENKIVDETQKEKVIYQNSQIEYSLLMGRSFKDKRLDYQAQLAVPILSYFKIIFGYEFLDKRMFLGSSFSF